ncbi:MAG: O-antigen ligase family protein [Saprospiraceae bacterium]|nr:O-antigen ligase family protein [Saprospiraceae bacterium]
MTQFEKWAFQILALLLPWSVDVDLGNWNLTLPSEPLIAFLGILLAWRITRTGWNQQRNNKLLIVSFIWICWSAVCALLSDLKTISMKYWIVDAGHWWVFFVGMAFYPELWRRVLPYFRYSMLGVVVYTLIRHGQFDFRVDQALLAPMPFFPDHTMYAAVLTMLIWLPAAPGVRILEAAGLALSTCRAAVLSLVTAMTAFAGFHWRKRVLWLVLSAVVLLAGIVAVAPRLNRSIQNDVSMQERFNRWHCATEMMAQKPLFGSGPGTYAFVYFPYQRTENLTRISVFEPLTERGPATYGRGGGAHSEYMQAGAENGLMGLLIWLVLSVGSLWLGFSQAAATENSSQKKYLLLLTLGLFTYLLHALLNNFLHDGRIAFLYWGMLTELSRPSFPEISSS